MIIKLMILITLMVCDNKDNDKYGHNNVNNNNNHDDDDKKT